MVKLESFKDLSKKQDDLLKKNFYIGSIGLVTLSISRENHTFHGRLGENESGASFPLFLSAWQEYKSDSWALKLKRGNHGVFNLGLEVFPKSLNNFNAKFSYQQEKGSTKPSLIINFANDKVKASAELTQGSVYNSFTCGTPKVGGGLETAADLEHGKFSLAALALWWGEKHSRFVAKHETVDSNPFTFGKFDLGMYRKIDKSLKIAANVKCNWVDKATDIEMSGEYQTDSNGSIKGKINSAGTIGAAWKKTFSPSICTVINAETSSESLFAHSFLDIKFGFRLNITQ